MTKKVTKACPEHYFLPVPAKGSLCRPVPRIVRPAPRHSLNQNKQDTHDAMTAFSGLKCEPLHRRRGPDLSLPNGFPLHSGEGVRERSGAATVLPSSVLYITTQDMLWSFLFKEKAENMNLFTGITYQKLI